MKGDKEVIKPARSIVLHDVPEDGTTSDFDHGLRFYISLFRKPTSNSTCKDCYFNFFHNKIISKASSLTQSSGVIGLFILKI